MKKKEVGRLFYAVTAALFLSACSSTGESGNNVNDNNDNDNKKVEDVKEEKKEEKNNEEKEDKNNESNKAEEEEKEPVLTEEESDWVCVSECQYLFDGSWFKTENTCFDSDYNVLETRKTIAENEYIYCIYYDFDDEGRPVVRREYNTYGDIMWVYRYKYDVNGRLIEETCSGDENEPPESRIVYQYDKNGRIMQEQCTTDGGEDNSVTVYSYDADGNLEKKTTTGDGGVYEYSCYCDADGNVVRIEDETTGIYTVYEYVRKEDLDLGIRTHDIR